MKSLLMKSHSPILYKKGRYRKLNKIEQFQLFSLENYKITLNISGKKALDVFEKNAVFNFLESGFDVLHTQSVTYIVDEIIRFIETRQ